MATQGVILLAFGRVQYTFMAAHLAMSIKHFSPNVKIKFVHDKDISTLSTEWLKFFDETEEIKPEHLYRDGTIDPGWAKVNIYNYASFDKNIYLDVDGLCIKDITPLFNQNKFFATEVIGQGGKDDVINYSHWADNKEIWEFFNLPEDRVFRSVQSSFSYFEKGKESEAFYKKMQDNFCFPMKDLKNKWGKGLPDELIVSGTCAQIDHDPAIEGNAVFFGFRLVNESLTEIQEKFYINSLYGNGKGSTLVMERYKEWYDRMMRNISPKMGVYPIAKSFRLMKGKHVG